MKRIIIACDGTGQSASRGDHSVSTNINRFCHALRNSSDSPIQQIVFYQSGVGTSDLGSINKVIQGALGDGLEDNVVDGYTFIMNNYIPGDELYMFGFSRGAFTARVLANFVARLGVLRKPEYTWELKKAWKAYKEGAFEKYLTELEVRKNIDKRYAHLPRALDVEVTVVGCWDTVASLGVPWKPISNSGGTSGEYEHFDGSLVKGIKHAFHALALDEYRGPFTPTLWFLPKDSDSSSIDLQQCWFPGVHTNVGGGYADQALADLTLAWMIDLCRPFLDFSHEYIKLVVKLDHHPETIRSKDRENPKHGGFDDVYQGWGRGRCYDSYKNGQTWTWKYRTPGAYVDKDGKEGRTNETLHASVRERWVSSRREGLKTGPAVWAPEALKGFELEEVQGGWTWKKKVPKGGSWWPIGKKTPAKEVVINESAFPARPMMAEDGNPSTAEGSFELLLQQFI